MSGISININGDRYKNCYKFKEKWTFGENITFVSQIKINVRLQYFPHDQKGIILLRHTWYIGFMFFSINLLQ